jgi:hypothetical protein
MLTDDADRFNSLLTKIPSDRALWEVDRPNIESGSAADQLHGELLTLKKVGWVTAGKLMAAKRPRLVPILDKEVKGLLKPPRGRFWVTMYDELSDSARRRIIAEATASAPADVSLLRRIDVALWMHATHP